MPESRAPPNGASQVAHVEAVDPDRAGARRAPRRARARSAIAGVDRRRQAVVGAVGERDRLGLVVEGLQRQHRAEDLVAAGSRRPAGDVDEERRLVVAGRRSRRRRRTSRPRALLRARGATKPLDALELRRVDERADVGRRLARVADRARRRRGAGSARGTRRRSPLRPAAACRPGRPGRRCRTGRRRCVDGGVEVGVGEDDERRLAAELEGDRREVAAAASRCTPCGRRPSR